MEKLEDYVSNVLKKPHLMRRTRYGNVSIASTELELLEIIKDKNDMISMKELSTKAGFEIGYTYMLCRSLEKQDCIGFFTRSSCRITAKGKSMVG